MVYRGSTPAFSWSTLNKSRWAWFKIYWMSVHHSYNQCNLSSFATGGATCVGTPVKTELSSMKHFQRRPSHLPISRSAQNCIRFGFNSLSAAGWVPAYQGTWVLLIDLGKLPAQAPKCPMQSHTLFIHSLFPNAFGFPLSWNGVPGAGILPSHTSGIRSSCFSLHFCSSDIAPAHSCSSRLISQPYSSVS